MDEREPSLYENNKNTKHMKTTDFNQIYQDEMG